MRIADRGFRNCWRVAPGAGDIAKRLSAPYCRIPMSGVLAARSRIGRKKLGTQKTCMLHFAYGSNMSVALMRRRCPGAQLEGCARLPGYRFIVMRSGYASVVPAPGSSVHGLLWRLTPRDVAALNAYENLDSGLYRAVMMAVVSHRRRCAALVYIGCDCESGRPRPGYLEIVTQAARDAGFPPRYLRGLERWASA